MAACPALNTLLSNLDPVTTDNESQLRLSTYTRTVGTQVTLSCINDYELKGASTVTCQSDQTWNYTEKPFCAKVEDGLSNSMKLLIGLLVGGIVLMVIIVIIIACCIRRRRRKKLSKQDKFYRHLQEENFPKGPRLGEAVNEIAFKPPSYATAWPGMSHTSLVVKREYPFRAPDPDKNIESGKSIWDNTDYFVGITDLQTTLRSDEVSSSTTKVRQYSEEDNMALVPYRPNQQMDEQTYRQRSISDDVDSGRNMYARSNPNRDMIQRQVSYRRSNSPLIDERVQSVSMNVDRPFRNDDFYKYGRQNLSRGLIQRNSGYIVSSNPQTEERVQTISTGVNRQAEQDDVIVQVRIPSRYLQPKKEVIEEKQIIVSPRREISVADRAGYTQVLPTPHRTQARQVSVSETEIKETTKPKAVYQGVWPMRTEIKSLTEFNKRALLNNADPFLWRPVDSNFGYDQWHHAKF